jgi:class 3 adenylate cyclase
MEAPPLDRKLVAILAADVEGYSRIMEQDEERALRTLSSHRTLTDEQIVRHGGRIASTAGDSIIAEFGSVLNAVQAAVAMQSDLAEANAQLPEAERMLFRIGINVGDVMAKDGDIFGDGVNIAARLQALAEPGGVCVSRGVRDQVRRKLPYTYADLGEQRVKNIAQPIRCYLMCLDPAEADAGQAAKGADEDADPEIPTADAGQDEPAAEAERQIELAFWTSAEESGKSEDLRAYLERYPEGAFAPLARSRLAEPAKPAGAEPGADPVELAFWETVSESDNPAMFEAYLKKYPDGEFRALAEIRMGELRGA